MNTSVILIAYQSDPWMDKCIVSLSSASERTLHLVLVDNGGNSSLESLDYTALNIERLKTPHSMGFAEANNYALTHATKLHEHVVFLNQDTISHPAWIDTCIKHLDSEPTLGAISPFIRTYDGRDWDPSFLACLPSGEMPLDRSEEMSEAILIYTAHIPAPAMVLKSRVLQKVGPFDPVYGSYYEDYDLCLRIRRAGFKVGFCRDAEINHFSGSATDNRKKELSRLRLIIRNRLLYRVRSLERVGSRPGTMLEYMFIHFPRNIVRGMLGRSGSQPPLVTLRALGDIIRLVPRYCSGKRDIKAWRNYLESIRWSENMARAFQADHTN